MSVLDILVEEHNVILTVLEGMEKIVAEAKAKQLCNQYSVDFVDHSQIKTILHEFSF